MNLYKFTHFIPKKIKWTVIPITLGIMSLGVLWLLDIGTDNIHPLTKSWEKTVPQQSIPQGLTSISAQSCGLCHIDHYREWQYSTHSHAWTDLQFQAEIKKESSPFFCINCHIPLQNQQEFIVQGMKNGDIYQPVKIKNPVFDTALQQEGITCAVCHVRNGAIIGPTGSPKAPHKTVKDKAFLSEKLCTSCHNAVAVITPTLACTFQTGDEWKSGPFYGEKNCISCHMPRIHREIFPGFGKKPGRIHYFPGSGIPKFDTVKSMEFNGLTFRTSPIAESYTKGDTFSFDLKVKNELAGHKVPTGDPERFFIITLDLINASGDTLERQTNRIGEIWQWHPIAKKLSDNNMLPQEERHYTLTHALQKNELLTLNVVVTKHRLNEEAHRYNNLGSDYPCHITIFDECYAIEVKQ